MLSEKLETMSDEMHQLLHETEGEEEKARLYDVIEAMDTLILTVKQRSEDSPGPR